MRPQTLVTVQPPFIPHIPTSRGLLGQSPNTQFVMNTEHDYFRGEGPLLQIHTKTLIEASDYVLYKKRSYKNMYGLLLVDFCLIWKISGKKNF